MSQELTDEELLYASEEDWAFYKDAIIGLPTREGFKGNFMDRFNVEIPHGSGPHILRHFREAIEIANPNIILEIGFNIGHGAAMLLKLGAKVHSIDISHKWETFYSAMHLERKYPNKFLYSHRDQMAMPIRYYNMAFIDGAHDVVNVTKDIRVCKQLEIEYLLLDDYYKRYGDVQLALREFPELELVKDMNNLRLYKVNY